MPKAAKARCRAVGPAAYRYTIFHPAIGGKSLLKLSHIPAQTRDPSALDAMSKILKLIAGKYRRAYRDYPAFGV